MTVDGPLAAGRSASSTNDADPALGGSALDTEVERIDEAIRQLRARHPRGQVRAAAASLMVHVEADLAEAARQVVAALRLAAR